MAKMPQKLRCRPAEPPGGGVIANLLAVVLLFRRLCVAYAQSAAMQHGRRVALAARAAPLSSA
jgi:hypothetical protein